MSRQNTETRKRQVAVPMRRAAIEKSVTDWLAVVASIVATEPERSREWAETYLTLPPSDNALYPYKRAA